MKLTFLLTLLPLAFANWTEVLVTDDALQTARQYRDWYDEVQQKIGGKTYGTFPQSLRDEMIHHVHKISFSSAELFNAIVMYGDKFRQYINPLKTHQFELRMATYPLSQHGSAFNMFGHGYNAGDVKTMIENDEKGFNENMDKAKTLGLELKKLKRAFMEILVNDGLIL